MLSLRIGVWACPVPALVAFSFVRWAAGRGLLQLAIGYVIWSYGVTGRRRGIFVHWR